MTPLDSELSTEVLASILALPRPLLFALDVDGTLAPIAADPGNAGVPKPVQDALMQLAGRDGIIVALITGRSSEGLQRMLNMPSVWRSVEHGRVTLEPGAPYGTLPLSPEEQARLSEFTAWLEAQPFAQLGVRIEKKPASVTLHVRELRVAEPDVAQDALLATERKAHAMGLHARQGKAACEVEATHADKGTALDDIYRRSGAKSVFYAGDDTTDLPAITCAINLGGIGVFVDSSERPGHPPVGSRVLADVDAVHALVLDMLDRL